MHQEEMEWFFAPSISTLCTSSTGCSCPPGHSAHNWQEGTWQPVDSLEM